MSRFRKPDAKGPKAQEALKQIASDMHVVTNDLMAGLGNTFSDFLGVALGTAALEIAKAGLGVEPTFWPLGARAAPSPRPRFAAPQPKPCIQLCRKHRPHNGNPVARIATPPRLHRTATNRSPLPPPLADLISMVMGCLLGVFLPALIKHKELLGGEKYHGLIASFAWSQITLVKRPAPPASRPLPLTPSPPHALSPSHPSPPPCIWPS